MREEVISSGGTVDPVPMARSASPAPTTAASSAGASSPAVATNVGSVDYLGSTHGSKTCSLTYLGSQYPRTSTSTNARGSALGSSQPSCRPWERGDLLCRLATFKPSNWSGKPKEAGSLACARRGWMNVDTDKIECETCGVQLCFAAPSSWTPAEAEMAGGAFLVQLDSGHKVSCPWRGNCCADSLVQFPPTPPAALIGGYKDRYDGLLQFNSLPVIVPSVVDRMRQSRASQIDRFLSQSYAFFVGEFSLRMENIDGAEVPSEDEVPSSAYNQAQKLISLCGWEPRWLPIVQDFEEHSAQSARYGCSFDPMIDIKLRSSQDCGFSKNALSASVMKETGKKKNAAPDSRLNSRSPLLDCSLCGATVRIWDFSTVPRPHRFGSNNVDTPETSKKMGLTRGISAASGISGWVPTDGAGKDQTEDRDEAATTDVVKSSSNVGVDLNLTMAGGLPSTLFNEPAAVQTSNAGGMGRDLAIGQPSVSEVGERAASFESRGPSSTRKRSLEEGGSTCDRPHDKAQQADSIEATVIDRDGDEVDDSRQSSGGHFKRARGLEIFSAYPSSQRNDSSRAGPSHGMSFDISIDDSDPAAGPMFTRDSTRASSVIAMDTVCHSSAEDSMESVENYPGDAADDAHFSSPKNLDMQDAFRYDNSHQARQSACTQPAGRSSTNAEEEVLNAAAETGTIHGRDTFSVGISGGSVGMGASHEAEIRGAEFSIHGYAERATDVTEHHGQTGEFIPGPGLMGEFVPDEEMDREDPHDESQGVVSRSAVRAESSSKVYGLTKAESVESGQKMSQGRSAHRTLFNDSSAHHPSLSCNAVIYSGYEVSKEEVTQADMAETTDYAPNGLVALNGENDFEGGAGEFDPIQYHHHFCPWVNGNVAAAGCSSGSSSASTSSVTALSGWQLTLDALDAYHSLGHIPNQTLESESAASLYKDEHLASNAKLLRRSSTNKSHGQG